jgi:hypothetical protein
LEERGMTEIQEQFMQLYRSDDEFHHAVDRLLAGEVDDLREALLVISRMRRGDFMTGFHYETAVRKVADHALRRMAAA